MHIRFGPGATRKRTCHNGHLASGLPVLRFAGDPAGPRRYPGRADAGLIALSLRHFPGCLLIDVHDADPSPPVLSRAGDGAENGRGLVLIDTLSTQWSYFFPPDGVPEKDRGRGE
jgi:hypothetical protein